MVLSLILCIARQEWACTGGQRKAAIAAKPEMALGLLLTFAQSQSQNIDQFLELVGESIYDQLDHADA